MDTETTEEKKVTEMTLREGPVSFSVAVVNYPNRNNLRRKPIAQEYSASWCGSHCVWSLVELAIA